MKKTSKIRTQIKSKHKDLGRKRNLEKPSQSFRFKSAEAYEEMVNDYEDVFGDGFQGFDDNYYYEDEDNY